ncbi:MAG: hypothetical protein JXC85_05080 [Candidatus Aenigmarchaeota archaeon]|nr:hypothetical protein [Candidatus Aenigmarchaeota archaeon]
MKVGAGSILNRFKAKIRRDVIFSEDILANYILECEKAGYEKEVEEISAEWMNMIIENLFPHTVRKLPMPILSPIAKKIWTNIGLLDDFHVRKDKDIAVVETKNECITRLIGKNRFMPGLFCGILNVICEAPMVAAEVNQTKTRCKYVYKLLDEPWDPPVTKGKDKYNYLNSMPDYRGLALKDAFKSKILKLKSNNRVYFREKPLIIIENTLFHIISNRGILLDTVPSISFNYFREVIKIETKKWEKLNLLKNILHFTGWGIAKIAIKANGNVLIKIKYQPYGFQTEKDSWNFLFKIIEGYLHLLDKRFRIVSINESFKNIEATFSSN